MDELVRWLGEQLAEDERIARAAVGQATADWYASPVLASGSKLVTVRDRRDSRPMARLEDCDVQGEEPLFTAVDVAAHIAAHDPARVLREIEAKRRILAAHEREPMPKGDSADCAQCWGAVWPCSTLRLLALPFEDRPGFQESWRP